MLPGRQKRGSASEAVAATILKALRPEPPAQRCGVKPDRDPPQCKEEERYTGQQTLHRSESLPTDPCGNAGCETHCRAEKRRDSHIVTCLDGDAATRCLFVDARSPDRHERHVRHDWGLSSTVAGMLPKHLPSISRESPYWDTRATQTASWLIRLRIMSHVVWAARVAFAI